MKGSRGVRRRTVKEKYTFIKSRPNRFSVTTMCKVLEVHRSGFYAWLQTPLSARTKEDQRLARKIKQFWLESRCVYGYRNITIDLKRDGESCGKNKVLRVMQGESIRAVRGYRRHPGFKGGKHHPAAPNTLNREFTVTKPDQVWVTDFTYIRSHEGWLYVTVVIDVFSRRVIGWTMKRQLTKIGRIFLKNT